MKPIIINQFFELNVSKDIIFIHSINSETNKAQVLIYYDGGGLTDTDAGTINFNSPLTFKEFWEFYKEKLEFKFGSIVPYMMDIMKIMKETNQSN